MGNRAADLMALLLVLCLVLVSSAAGAVTELGDANPADCVLGEWSNFGESSQKCGGGKYTRSREIIRAAQTGGEACGKTQEERECNMEPCEQDVQVNMQTTNFAVNV